MRLGGAFLVSLTTFRFHQLTLSADALCSYCCCCYLRSNDEMKWARAAICKHHSDESVCKCDVFHDAWRYHWRKVEHECWIELWGSGSRQVSGIKWREKNKTLIRTSPLWSMKIYYGFHFHPQPNWYRTNSESSSSFPLFRLSWDGRCGLIMIFTKPKCIQSPRLSFNCVF